MQRFWLQMRPRFEPPTFDDLQSADDVSEESASEAGSTVPVAACFSLVGAGGAATGGEGNRA